MQVGAAAGKKALSKGLTDRYLRNANETYFAPRGLRVRLCRTSAMRRLIGLDPDVPSTDGKAMAFAKNVGKGVETVGLHLPIFRRIIARLDPAPTSVDPYTSGKDMATRLLAPLEGRIMPLVYDMPPPVKPTGLMNQFSELGVKLDVWKNNRAQAKSSRTREMLALSQGGYDQSGLTEASGSAGRRARRAQRKAQKQIGRGRAPTASRRLATRVAVADKKEYNETSLVLWIVVINAEQDKLIDDVELVDSKANFEEIDESEWEEELDLEDEEYERGLKGSAN